MEALKGLVSPAQNTQVSTHLEEHIQAIIAESGKAMQAKLEQYIQGAVEQRVSDALQNVGRVRIEEGLHTIKFELVKLIETEFESHMKSFCKKVSEFAED